MVSREKCIREFMTFGKKLKTHNLFSENDVLYSYGYHFPLCIRIKDGFIINKSKYSSRQQNCCRNHTNGKVIEVETNEIKKILNIFGSVNKSEILSDDLTKHRILEAFENAKLR